MSHWKHFIIGSSKEHATRFYAPDLTTALHAARGFFGTDALECYGASCATGSSSPTPLLRLSRHSQPRR